MKRAFLGLFFLTTMFVSCRQTPTQKPMPEERFQSLYIALLEAGELHRNVQPDSGQHFNADSIFRAFNTSEQEFRSTIAAHRIDPKSWQRFYDAVSRRLDEKAKQKEVRSKP